MPSTAAATAIRTCRRPKIRAPSGASTLAEGNAACLDGYGSSTTPARPLAHRCLARSVCRVATQPRSSPVPDTSATVARTASGVRAVAGLRRIYGAALLRRRVSELLLAFAELDPADLACEGLGEVVDELDPAGVRVLREPLAYELRDLCRQLVARVVSCGQNDERL